jgi:ElaB/YqjD/DUF883 family membrane-anchored ribosome-binding protein
MARSTDPSGEADADIRAELRQLREQLETLTREAVGPRLAEAAAQAAAQAATQAGAAAQEAKATLDEHTEALAGHVRAHPLAAVLIAAAAGFVFGRITR